MTDDERALCAVASILLRASGSAVALGLALSCIAASALALIAHSLSMAAATALGLAVVLGILERYLALRLRLDAGLFDALSNGGIDSLSTLDGLLRRLGMRRQSGPLRPLEDRIRGTRRLVQRHGIVVACQSAAFLLAMLAQYRG